MTHFRKRRLSRLSGARNEDNFFGQKFVDVFFILKQPYYLTPKKSRLFRNKVRKSQLSRQAKVVMKKVGMPRSELVKAVNRIVFLEDN